MRRIAFFIISLMMLMGCKKEPAADPAGTNSITINWTSTYGQDPLELYKGVDEDHPIYYPYIQLKLGIVDASMNFVFWSLQSFDPNFANTNNTVGNGGEMVDVGKVSGLGDVVSKPATGWSASSATQVGHGYVLRALSILTTIATALCRTTITASMWCHWLKMSMEE